MACVFKDAKDIQFLDKTKILSWEYYSKLMQQLWEL